MRKLSIVEFIERANEIHDNFYSYELSKYINVDTKILITCPLHGEFNQRPDHHLAGRKCKKCSVNSIKNIQKEKESESKYIERCTIIHKNKYDYSLVEYKDARSKVRIVCPDHGIFEQSLDTHSRGTECIKCSISKSIKRQTNTITEFINKANVIHNNFYSYENSSYISSKNDILITCPLHGGFYQQAGNHLSGKGCPICKGESKGEKLIRKYLESNSIFFIPQKTFIGCSKIKLLRFDFYIPHLNLCIEYDGKQHFEAVSIFGGEKALIENKVRDKIKNEFCIAEGINLIRFNYKQKDKFIISKLENI